MFIIVYITCLHVYFMHIYEYPYCYICIHLYICVSFWTHFCVPFSIYTCYMYFVYVCVYVLNIHLCTHTYTFIYIYIQKHTYWRKTKNQIPTWDSQFELQSSYTFKTKQSKDPIGRNNKNQRKRTVLRQVFCVYASTSCAATIYTLPKVQWFSIQKSPRCRVLLQKWPDISGMLLIVASLLCENESWGTRMGWLRLIGSLKSWISFAEYRLFYRALL